MYTERGLLWTERGRQINKGSMQLCHHSLDSNKTFLYFVIWLDWICWFYACTQQLTCFFCHRIKPCRNFSLVKDTDGFRVDLHCPLKAPNCKRKFRNLLFLWSDMLLLYMCYDWLLNHPNAISTCSFYWSRNKCKCYRSSITTKILHLKFYPSTKSITSIMFQQQTI